MTHRRFSEIVTELETDVRAVRDAEKAGNRRAAIAAATRVNETLESMDPDQLAAFNVMLATDRYQWMNKVLP